MSHSRYRKLAGEAYDRVADRTGRFEMGDVVQEIRAELTATGADAELLDEFAASLASQVDERRTSSADIGQYDLLTGEPAALDVVWRLGGGRRVRVRHAVREDVLTRLSLREENVKKVTASYEAEKRRLSILLPYLTGRGVTIPKAVARYHGDRSKKKGDFEPEANR